MKPVVPAALPPGPLPELIDFPSGPPQSDRIQTILTSLPNKYLRWQELMTDRFAGLNALSPDVEQAVARLGGVGDMQAQRAADIARTVKTALGPPWQDAEKYLDNYLHLKQAIDIEAAKGPQRLIPGGVKGAKEAQERLLAMEQALGPQRWGQLERAAGVAIQESQETLNRLVEGGLVARDLADQLLKQYPHYNKQNILRATEEMMQGGISTKRISVTSANLKRLTEYGTEQARTSPYASIIGSAAEAEALIARNQAARFVALEAIQQGIGQAIRGVRPVAQEAGELIFRRPAGEIPGTISYMEGGTRKVVAVPTWLEREAKALSQAADNTLINSVSWINALPRAAFVTYNPAWPAANLVTDYLAVALTKGVTPSEELRGIIGALKDVLGGDPVLAQMRRSGGGQAGWFARSPDEIAKLVSESGNLAIADERRWWDFAKAVASAPFRATKTYGAILEQATRRAVFTTSLKRQGFAGIAGAPKNALEKAAFEARRSTIDFRRAGDLGRAINAVSVFFNAGVQGTLLPFRALRDTPRARWALGAAMGANMGIYAWNRQFPEYEDVPRDVKRGSLVVMLPSTEFDNQGRRKPNYVTVIPKVREWGLFFGSMNYALETLDQRAHEDFRQFLGLMQAQSTPVEGVETIVPTVAGQVALEEKLNQDFYRQRPIVPPELAGEPPSKQYDAFTSETLKRVAQSFGWSPLRLQHVFYGLTGGAGRTATSLTDALLQKLAPTETDFRIAELAHELDQIEPPAVLPDQVALRRTEFLNGLSPEDRDAVLELERRAEPQVPIVGAMTRRFYAPRGGELRRLGQEAAEQVTGRSAEETADMGRALSLVHDQLRVRQLAQDQTLLQHPNNPDYAKQWREAHSENSSGYRMALLGLGVLFPNAAQLSDAKSWQDYQTAVYTLAGTIEDRRTKGQILVAGWRAIPLEETDPLTKDFDTFWQRREEYRQALNEADRALLERTLRSTMTETEQKYATDQETLRPYWEMEETARRTIPALDNAFRRIDGMLEREPQGSPRQRALEQEIEKLRRQYITPLKQRYLSQHPEAAKALIKWGYSKSQTTAAIAAR